MVYCYHVSISLNEFISENHPITSRKYTKKNILGSLFPFEFTNVYTYHKLRLKMILTKSQPNMSNEVNYFLACH